MLNLSTEENKALNEVAGALNVSPVKLWALIQFESGWQPEAKNPYSSARGLIQFIDSTARGLGYKSSIDLVNKNPDRISQLKNPVYNYLKKYKPFINDQSLYMSVFLPSYRYESVLKPFPATVQKVNPGIKKPYDYIKKVNSKINLFFAPAGLFLIGGILLLFFTLKKE